MKKLFSTWVISGFILVSFLIYPNRSLSYDFKFNELYYSINSDGQSVTVTNATNISSIVIPATVSFSNGLFNNTYKVTSIGERAFFNCDKLTSIVIGNNVTGIEKEAFGNCYSLASVAIPEGIKVIGSSAFGNCKGLTSIDIPNGVEIIDDLAFYGCTALNSIVIPKSVTHIGENVFRYCTGLTTATIDSGVTNISYEMFSKCNNLTSVVLPNSITNIEAYAFDGCSALTSIDIPKSVTNIGNGAFNECTNLSSLDIPDGVTSIGDRTFFNCNKLKSVTIPERVTSIGSWAFYNCKNHIVIICKATEVPSRESDSFQNAIISAIYVPESSLDAYKQAKYWLWSKNVIFPMSDLTQLKELKANETYNQRIGVYAPIYDLSGRVLNEKPASGYYIQNGKKYFVK